MTENEAIKKHIEECDNRIRVIHRGVENHTITNSGNWKNNLLILSEVVKVLEEIQQYRSIGTVEEFKALKEKAEPKKPRKIRDNIYNRILHYSCPICGRYFGQRGEHNMILFNKELYCQEKNCGQAIDWSEEE